MITHTGTVTRYYESRGFGFILEFSDNKAERFAEQFFHVNDVTQRIALKVGDVVYFQIGPSSRKPGMTQAFDVRLSTANAYVPSGAVPLSSDAPVNPSPAQDSGKGGA
jgi:cold shock CspA family protein